MTLQARLAARGKLSEEMRIVAKDEGLTPNQVRQGVARGSIVILKSSAHEEAHPAAVGQGLRVKCNVNVGTSPDLCDLSLELEKVKVAVKHGTDTLMDLSLHGNLDEIRRALIKATDKPFGSVPVYQAIVEAKAKKGSTADMSEDDLFDVIERHIKDGVDFMTIHAGISKQTVEELAKHPRLMGIVSRGGCLLASWMKQNEKENPLLENFDSLLEMVQECDVTLSLGDALRPGCIFDSTDHHQVQELLTVARLVERAREKGVQVVVEGPGHLPLDQVVNNVKMAKSICKEAPFYVLGPLVTDVAPGLDQIVSAIGGAVAASAGADWLCVVTPSEHLGFPLVEDIKQGLLATKVAAHAADIVRLGKKASDWDYKIDLARVELDWSSQFKRALDPELARRIHQRVKSRSIGCSLCGEYCALSLSKRLRGSS
jgi:phosphomethylpyrimidine synthase